LGNVGNPINDVIHAVHVRVRWRINQNGDHPQRLGWPQITRRILDHQAVIPTHTQRAQQPSIRAERRLALVLQEEGIIDSLKVMRHPNHA